MNANALLFWMSARRQGSWPQFRSAVEELHVDSDDVTGTEEDDAPEQFSLPLYQELRLNLQRLGHAEFFNGAGDAEWRVCPPSLAVAQHAAGWIGILTGARSSKLLQRVYAAGASEMLQKMPIPACPDQILVRAKHENTFVVFAERSGLFLQRDAPASLLNCLPPIDDPSVRYLFSMPFGTEWKIDRFSPKELRWRVATRDEATLTPGGLFRFSLRHQRYLLFCSRGEAFRVPGQVGKFLALRRSRRRVLHYDAGNLRLSVPASCRPPFLVERALILCSGTLPTYQGDSGAGKLEYTQIPASIAMAAAALLRQELQ